MVHLYGTPLAETAHKAKAREANLTPISTVQYLCSWQTGRRNRKSASNAVWREAGLGFDLYSFSFFVLFDDFCIIQKKADPFTWALIGWLIAPPRHRRAYFISDLHPGQEKCQGKKPVHCQVQDRRNIQRYQQLLHLCMTDRTHLCYVLRKYSDSNNNKMDLYMFYLYALCNQSNIRFVMIGIAVPLVL